MGAANIPVVSCRNNDEDMAILDQFETLKEGYLQKQSVHLHVYRKRWIVLKARKAILCYKDETKRALTETFDMSEYSDVHLNQSTEFSLISADKTRTFRATNERETKKWVECIQNVLISQIAETKLIRSRSSHEVNSESPCDLQNKSCFTDKLSAKTGKG